MESYIRNISFIPTFNHNVESGFLVTLVNKYEEKEPIEQVYIAVCGPGEIKGPHFHEGNKYDRFYCIEGRMLIVCREEKTSQISEFILSAFDKNLLIIPPYNSHALIALDGRRASVISIPSEGYRSDLPYNQIETNYENYDWTKWL